MFRFVLWCETLFQRTEAHDDATSFDWKLISAAANSDLRSKTQLNPVVSFLATQPGLSSYTSTGLQYFDLITFFSETPPPPLNRCSPRFNEGHGEKARVQQFRRSCHPSRMRPLHSDEPFGDQNRSAGDAANRDTIFATVRNVNTTCDACSTLSTSALPPRTC